MHPQVPPSFLGRSFEPVLPPVNALSPEELARMQYAAVQGGNQARANRIGEVMAMRVNDLPTMEDVLLQPPSTTQRAKALPKAAMQKRQSLLDVLGGHRQYLENVDGSY